MKVELIKVIHTGVTKYIIEVDGVVVKEAAFESDAFAYYSYQINKLLPTTTSARKVIAEFIK